MRAREGEEATDEELAERYPDDDLRSCSWDPIGVCKPHSFPDWPTALHYAKFNRHCRSIAIIRRAYHIMKDELIGYDPKTGEILGNWMTYLNGIIKGLKRDAKVSSAARSAIAPYRAGQRNGSDGRGRSPSGPRGDWEPDREAAAAEIQERFDQVTGEIYRKGAVKL